MKVLLISTRYRGGGAERNARELFERLPARGFEPTMFVADRAADDPPAVHGLRLAGEKYLRALEWVLPPQDWRLIGSRLSLGRLPAGGFDVVHFHNLHGGWMSTSAASRLAQRFPTVWTLHDEWAVTGGLPYDLARVFGYDEFRTRYPSPHGFPLHHDERYARAVAARTGPRLPRPTTMVCPSGYLAELVAATPRFQGVPVRQIPYGLTMLDGPGVAAPRDAARAAFGIPGGARVILMVAAAFDSPYKGIPFAVDALRRLRPGEAEVLALGPSAAAVLRDLPVRVTCPGHVSDPETLAKAYRAADLTLIPSVADNFPYVALESFACGTPLATFRVGGLTEMVGDNDRGLLATPFVTAELLANVRKLLDDSELARRMGQAGRRWVEDHCRMEHQLDQLTATYRDAVERFNHGRGASGRDAAAAVLAPGRPMSDAPGAAARSEAALRGARE
jgi:glycosyltransferase involved in cell wall biosynthesis